MSDASTLVVILAGMIALGTAASAALVVVKTGAMRGWKETAEAFKARSEQQTVVIDENAQSIASLARDVAAARERIAVLEARPEERALERHEGIVSALTAIEHRLREQEEKR